MAMMTVITAYKIVMHRVQEIVSGCNWSVSMSVVSYLELHCRFEKTHLATGKNSRWSSTRVFRHGRSRPIWLELHSTQTALVRLNLKEQLEILVAVVLA